MQGIYKITNKIDGKCYIGQSINIKERWESHKACKTNIKLANAINKYGLENFNFEVLKLVDNKDKLTEYEQYYYNIYKPEYNLIYPGESPNSKNKKAIYQIDINTLQIIKKWSSISDASRAFGVREYAIQSVLFNMTTSCCGYYWCYVDNYDTWIPRTNKNHYIPCQEKYPVAMIDIDTNEIIRIFDSAKQASIETNSLPSKISACCHGKRNKHNGYKWSFITNL